MVPKLVHSHHKNHTTPLEQLPNLRYKLQTRSYEYGKAQETAFEPLASPLKSHAGSRGYRDDRSCTTQEHKTSGTTGRS